MTVDINAYYGTWPYWPLINNDLDSMLRKMDRYEIEWAFLASLKGVFVDPAEGNREVLKVASEHSDRFRPALTYSPYASGKESFRRELEEAGVVLVKLYPVHHSYDPLEEPFIAELLEYCGKYGIPVMIPHRLMMTWRLPTFEIRKIGLLAEAHPETKLVIGSVNYLFELQTAFDVVRRYPNVFLDTSAMMAYREIEIAVKNIGAERLLHGTCNPLQNPAIGPLKIRTAQIDDADQRRILGGNVLTLLKERIPDASPRQGSQGSRPIPASE